MAGLTEVDLDATTLDWLTSRIVGALARDERVGAAALLLLLRRLPATSGADVTEALGTALARELADQAQLGRGDDAAAWIGVFSEAAAVSDDPRLGRAAGDLLASVRPDWRTGAQVDAAMRAVDACLVSMNVLEARELAAEAIDGLERVVAAAYRPGEGMAHEVGALAFVRGSLADQVRSASALLTAYMLTGRLPYPMLADELMQCVLRTSWDERDGGLLEALGTLPGDESTKPFALNCEAARVFCRLAALHRDDEYRQAAVIASGADYARTAARTLASQARSVRPRGVEAAPFGLALAEWLDLQSHGDLWHSIDPL